MDRITSTRCHGDGSDSIIVILVSRNTPKPFILHASEEKVVVVILRVGTRLSIGCSGFNANKDSVKIEGRNCSSFHRDMTSEQM